MTKDELRSIVQQRIHTLSSEEITLQSEHVVESIIHTKQYKEAQAVLAYVALHDEINLSSLFDYLQQGDKRLFLPKVESDGIIQFYEAGTKWDQNLIVNKYHILEPPHTSSLYSESDFNSTLIIVPAVAYDVEKRRLGRGGGYYDRYLGNSKSHAFALGVCFDIQLLDYLPTLDHDQRVDAIISYETSLW
ncbi:MAG: 5-formyltetrahydrofolate cyclo-ligase [Sphaerochaetaceae bacterium]